ncbi:MAG: hypothetical protein IT313_14015 [Anaerolineales bacterium]|nr:hypothetical protein [Anaerolineales bacterium]
MKKQTTFLLLATFLISTACQWLFPAASNRDGTIISSCTDLVTAFRGVQPGGTPQSLLETGFKQGGEFDVSAYFEAFTHISMEEGYELDYVYQLDGLGAYPILYAHPVDQAPYLSMTDVPTGAEIGDYLDHVSIDDTEHGYFEFVAMSVMAGQFYLEWHANYNDTEIVCSDDDVDSIIKDLKDGDFGIPFDASQQVKAQTMRDIEPLVKLTDKTAVVEIVTFTKWGGFYRQTYTINRSFPHTILDVKSEIVVEYDCGIMF